MLLSFDDDTNLYPSGEKDTPFTVCVWSYADTKHFLYAISQIFIYPSWDPEIILFNANGHFAMTLIPSEWPYKVPINGLANILFSLTAL